MGIAHPFLQAQMCWHNIRLRFSKVYKRIWCPKVIEFQWELGATLKISAFITVKHAVMWAEHYQPLCKLVGYNSCTGLISFEIEKSSGQHNSAWTLKIRKHHILGEFRGNLFVQKVIHVEIMIIIKDNDGSYMNKFKEWIREAVEGEKICWWLQMLVRYVDASKVDSVVSFQCWCVLRVTWMQCHMD